MLALRLPVRRSIDALAAPSCTVFYWQAQNGQWSLYPYLVSQVSQQVPYCRILLKYTLYTFVHVRN